MLEILIYKKIIYENNGDKLYISYLIKKNNYV